MNTIRKALKNAMMEYYTLKIKFRNADTIRADCIVIEPRKAVFRCNYVWQGLIKHGVFHVADIETIEVIPSMLSWQGGYKH